MKHLNDVTLHRPLYSCAGKESFSSARLARDVLKRMLRSKGRRGAIEAYHCKFCKHWHIGRSTKNR